MGNIAISTEQLVKDFGAFRAVDGLSLEVPAGIVFGFLGPNGSGKTTTIYMLLGLLEPSAGRAEVLGLDVRTGADEIRRQSGVLLEFHGLYERLNAADNLEFYGRVWRMPETERRTRIKELLTRMGLWERRNEAVGKWSRGMKQKLAIARAMLHRPALLFLDEPSAGLDPVAADALRNDIAVLAADENVTVFLTTHNLAEAEKLCARVGIIDRGRLLALGRPEDLKSSPGSARIEVVGRGFDPVLAESLRAMPGVLAVSRHSDSLIIDTDAAGSVAKLITYIAGTGAEIEEVRRNGASLEDAFLALLEES